MIDLSFRAIGMEVLAREWPAFAGGAAIHVYLGTRVYRSRHYSIQWIVVCVSVALTGIASMGFGSMLATERLIAPNGEGAHTQLWEELTLVWERVWPPLLGFGWLNLRCPRAAVPKECSLESARPHASWPAGSLLSGCTPPSMKRS